MTYVLYITGIRFRDKQSNGSHCYINICISSYYESEGFYYQEHVSIKESQ